MSGQRRPTSGRQSKAKREVINAKRRLRAAAVCPQDEKGTDCEAMNAITAGKWLRRIRANRKGTRCEAIKAIASVAWLRCICANRKGRSKEGNLGFPLWRTHHPRSGWCRWSDSNRRPDAYEAPALPTELQRRTRPYFNPAPAPAASRSERFSRSTTLRACARAASARMNHRGTYRS